MAVRGHVTHEARPPRRVELPDTQRPDAQAGGQCDGDGRQEDECDEEDVPENGVVEVREDWSTCAMNRLDLKTASSSTCAMNRTYLETASWNLEKTGAPVQ